MLEKRGLDRGSVLVGRSVHNQRLCHDVFNAVTQLYYHLFYSFEEKGILDHLSEKHLFALHYVYIPRINRALHAFTQGWNNHPLSTVLAMKSTEKQTLSFQETTRPQPKYSMPLKKGYMFAVLYILFPL